MDDNQNAGVRMKRVLCVALALSLLAMGGAEATAGLDFSGMTLHELYDARAELDAAIAALEGDGDATFYEDGSYLVGVDIPEGDYVLLERENAVFASVAIRDDDSADAAPILHKLVIGRAVIRLTRGTWVTFSELRVCPLGHEPEAWCPDGSVGEGAYLVGRQIAPGRYTVTPLDRAPLSSYSVYTDILGTQAQLIKFEVLHEAVALNLSEGEYVELSGCALYPEAP